MRNLQFRRVDGLFPVKKNVQVNQARTFGYKFLASHVGLDSAQSVQQIQRRLLCRGLHDAIQEPRLVAKVYRLGLVKRGDMRHTDSDIS